MSQATELAKEIVNSPELGMGPVLSQFMQDAGEARYNQSIIFLVRALNLWRLESDAEVDVAKAIDGLKIFMEYPESQQLFVIDGSTLKVNPAISEADRQEILEETDSLPDGVMSTPSKNPLLWIVFMCQKLFRKFFSSQQRNQRDR